MEFSILIAAVVAGAVGMAIGWTIVKKTAQGKVAEAELEAERLLNTAQGEAEELKRKKVREAKEEFNKKKANFQQEFSKRREKLQAVDNQLKKREANLEKNLSKKLETVTQKESALADQQQELKKERGQIAEASKDLDLKRKEIDNLRSTVEQQKKVAEELIAEQNHRLERISGMSREDAKKFLMENMVNEAKLESAQMVKDVRDEANIEAKKVARNIIIQAIQRTASDHSVETTVSVVNLTGDEMKGRIIGREGRNIRAFEAATGVDVIVDDTPEAVIISGFDPFRREVARVALERLMQDGRIHPARIEEVVEKTRKELEEDIVQTGKNTLLELGIGNVHPEIVRLIGRMKYRSSYGQNVLSHSIEVAYLTGVMARELDLNVDQAMRAGLMHDMGKCVDRNIEGPHALLGYDIAKRYKEHPIVCNAIGAHHDDIEMESPIAVLVQAADSISGARPGARRESLEAYVKRLETLETLARSFDGVEKTYAIQAGREVRVMVEPDRVDDLFADQLAHDIAGKIQQEMEYPGQIKVMVIREKRSVSYAK
ncbi:MAG: ribonuclease Y [Ignavibacteriae bacterium]|nr:ribonuclease Y [Ignavibacteriota bacterium]MCB9217139.1 ribonuclease Y [Ignavibacteria bacterium]